MATTYAVQSYSGAGSPIAFTANGTSTGTPIRYAYVAVTNLGTAVIYASMLNSAPAVGGDNTEAIMPNEIRLLANETPYWTQAATAIRKGTLAGGTPGTPAEIQPTGHSLYGATVSPGTTVYLSGTGPWSVEGTG